MHVNKLFCVFDIMKIRWWARENSKKKLQHTMKIQWRYRDEKNQEQLPHLIWGRCKYLLQSIGLIGMSWLWTKQYVEDRNADRSILAWYIGKYILYFIFQDWYILAWYIHFLEYQIPPPPPLSSVTFFRVQWILGTERAIIDPLVSKRPEKNLK